MSPVRRNVPRAMQAEHLENVVEMGKSGDLVLAGPFENGEGALRASWSFERWTPRGFERSSRRDANRGDGRMEGGRRSCGGIWGFPFRPDRKPRACE
jgi:hypothetical protein